MRQFLLGLTISLAFIVGSMSSQLLSRVVPRAHAGGEMGRWIYRCESLSPENPTKFMNAPDVVGKLNELGRQGWELVLEMPHPQNAFLIVFCFKQPLH